MEWWLQPSCELEEKKSVRSEDIDSGGDLNVMMDLKKVVLCSTKGGRYSWNLSVDICYAVGI